MTSPMNIICLGASFTGRYLSDNFSDEVNMYFLSRTADNLPVNRYTALTPDNYDDVVTDGEVDAILDTVPAIMDDGKLVDPPYVYRVRRVLNDNPDAAYVHISTTSVYPTGGTVEREDELPVYDETTPADPDSGSRGANRLLLETRIRQFYPDAKIVRAGGLYGPGRCTAERFRDGSYRQSDFNNRVISRIHVHDLCRIVLKLFQSETDTRLVNAVDEQPSLNSETYAFIEETLGIEIPGDWRKAPPEGRKVTSLYAKDLLQGSYTYSTYREGFRDCLSR